MNKFFARYCFLATFVLFACVSEKGNDQKSSILAKTPSFRKMEYATQFRIAHEDNYKILEVQQPWPGATDTFRYYLYHDQLPPVTSGVNSMLVKLPLKDLVCFSTTHLPYLEMLGSGEMLSGFPTTDYISSDFFRRRIEKGEIKDLGPSNEINIESLIALDPDLVIAYSMGNDLSIIRKIQLSGIPVILNADYMEKHPLGRAEWIKFMATFLDKEERADSIFSDIRNEYLITKKRVDSIYWRPTVITGVVYGDTWFMPGGEHYGSVFFQDAGAEYLWENNSSGETLQLSFETVYEKASQVDFWVGVATYNTLKEIKQADNRYAHFEAFKKGRVFNYTAQVGKKGGNAYFELGYARPDIVLKDLTKIFHPEVMTDHDFYFYKKLN